MKRLLPLILLLLSAAACRRTNAPLDLAPNLLDPALTARLRTELRSREIYDGLKRVARVGVLPLSAATIADCRRRSGGSFNWLPDRPGHYLLLLLDAGDALWRKPGPGGWTIGPAAGRVTPLDTVEQRLQIEMLLPEVTPWTEAWLLRYDQPVSTITLQNGPYRATFRWR